MKEAFVASLLTLVREPVEDDESAEEVDDPEMGEFGNVLQKQVIALRKDIAE